MFTKEFMPESATFAAHWRVADHHDNRVATCFDADNADAVVRAFNAMETDTQARNKLASMAEAVMRCALDLEALRDNHVQFQLAAEDAVRAMGEPIKKLRAAVLAAT